MEFDDSFAWLLTWTTYGSWLPGDPRGHISPMLLRNGRYEKRKNTPGVEWAAGDERTRRRARALQRFETVQLDGDEAFVVAQSIACAAISRNWRVLRGAVMTTHAHLVLQGAGGDSSAASRIVKGASQAALSERLGASRRWWTRGASERGLRGAVAVAAAIQYVANQEGMLAEIIDNIPSRPTPQNAFPDPAGRAAALPAAGGWGGPAAGNPNDKVTAAQFFKANGMRTPKPAPAHATCQRHRVQGRGPAEPLKRPVNLYICTLILKPQKRT